jgi:hypothetical protein
LPLERLDAAQLEMGDDLLAQGCGTRELQMRFPEDDEESRRFAGAGVRPDAVTQRLLAGPFERVASRRGQKVQAHGRKLFTNPR